MAMYTFIFYAAIAHAICHSLFFKKTRNENSVFLIAIIKFSYISLIVFTISNIYLFYVYDEGVYYLSSKIGVIFPIFDIGVQSERNIIIDIRRGVLENDELDFIREWIIIIQISYFSKIIIYVFAAFYFICVRPLSKFRIISPSSTISLGFFTACLFLGLATMNLVIPTYPNIETDITEVAHPFIKMMFISFMMPFFGGALVVAFAGFLKLFVPREATPVGRPRRYRRRNAR